MAKKRMAPNSSALSMKELKRLSAAAVKRHKAAFDTATQDEQILMIHAPRIGYGFENGHRRKSRRTTFVRKYLHENFGPIFAERVLANPDLKKIVGL